MRLEETRSAVPSARYVQLLVDGAQEHGLNDAYVEYLQYVLLWCGGGVVVVWEGVCIWCTRESAGIYLLHLCSPILLRDHQSCAIAAH